jgi:TolB-like protein/tetratricopeptide (TPR) repeat protein
VNFLQDLRRRRMFRLVGLYIVGAWVVIQVAEALFQAWGIPETAMRFVFIAAFLCFPIALVFGWIFDVTSEGIVRTKNATSNTAVSMQLQKTDYAILAALAAIGVVVMLGSAGLIQEEIESGHAGVVSMETRENSIAVLPFKNLDINAETGYFSDGVTEEILHRLSSLGTLHVLASTSSFSFRDSPMSPIEISASLGVRFLLAGSVRRSNNRVRVSARLLDASGFQVWEDTFDRELTEIFSVQADIANSVSRQIVTEIVPLADVPAGRTTENMEAYNAYLLGRHYADRRVADWRNIAGTAFREAIELDPGFAPPYAGLATLVVNTSLGPGWQEAAGYARKALQLDPELGEAHAILGLITTLQFDDPAAGAEMLERAIELDPSYSMSYSWLSLSLDLQGRGSESLNVLHRGVAIDPLNPVIVVNLAGKQEYSGNFEAAEQLLLRLLALPEISGPAGDILDLYHDWGRYNDELKSRKEIMRKTGRDSIGEISLLARNYAALGMRAQTDYWFDQYLRGGAEPFSRIADYYFVFKHTDSQMALRNALAAAEEQAAGETGWDRAGTLGYGGLAQIQIGKYEKGIQWLEESLELYRQLYQANAEPGEIDIMVYDNEWWTWLTIHIFQRLAFAYQQVGRAADADDILRQLDELLALVEPTVPAQHERRALQNGLHGDTDAAYESLATAVELGWANYFEVANDPAWSTTIADPRIAQLLEDARRRVEEQRRKVEKTEQAEDFAAEYLRLIAQ